MRISTTINLGVSFGRTVRVRLVVHAGGAVGQLVAVTVFVAVTVVVLYTHVRYNLALAERLTRW